MVIDNLWAIDAQTHENSYEDKSNSLEKRDQKYSNNRNNENEVSDKEKWHLSSEYWKNNGADPGTTKIYSPCRDRVNYGVLKNHKYEIIENPDRDSCKNSRIYVCKYDNWGKSFAKTWNLVDHFRIHTKEKPFVCGDCKKKFSQKCNLKRHIKLNGCIE